MFAPQYGKIYVFGGYGNTGNDPKNYTQIHLYGLKTSYVDPANTSKIGEKLAKKLGIDKHTASAYVITLKGIKSIKM